MSENINACYVYNSWPFSYANNKKSEKPELPHHYPNISSWRPLLLKTLLKRYLMGCLTGCQFILFRRKIVHLCTVEQHEIHLAHVLQERCLAAVKTAQLFPISSFSISHFFHIIVISLTLLHFVFHQEFKKRH